MVFADPGSDGLFSKFVIVTSYHYVAMALSKSDDDSGDAMKDMQLLSRYVIPVQHLAAGWQSSLWEDFPEEDLDDDEPPFDSEWGDLAQGGK